MKTEGYRLITARKESHSIATAVSKVSSKQDYCSFNGNGGGLTVTALPTLTHSVV